MILPGLGGAWRAPGYSRNAFERESGFNMSNEERSGDHDDGIKTGTTRLPLVVVTFDASPEEKIIIESVLNGVALVDYSHGLTETKRVELLREANVLFSAGFRREIGEQEYAELQHTDLIQLISAGVNNTPFADLPDSIVVAGNAGAYARPMAEHVMAMILALAKNVRGHDQELRSGNFDQNPPNRMLAGMKAGIVGFGGIGRATAHLMHAFDIAVLAITSSGRTAEAVGFAGTLDDLEHVLCESDIVLLALPLNKHTTGLIGGKQLGWMKDEAILINVARGGLIEEEALYRHALANPRFQIGLDVWWGEPFPDHAFKTKYPLLELPNVLGSPHNSAHVPGIWDEGARSAAVNIKRFLTSEDIVGRVRRADYV